MFINPRPSKRRRKSGRKAKKRSPRKTKRNSTRRKSYKRRPVKSSRKARKSMRKNTRSRRRNAGIAPFIRSNPLILRNSLRRRRRSNPGGNFSMKNILDKGLSYGGGSALGAGINMIALSKIEDKWFRNGARLAAAIGGGILLKGDLGAAAAGATLYPMWQEIAVMLKVISGPKPFLPYPDGSQTVKPTTASLDELSADLQDVLDEPAVDEIYDNYN